MPTADSRPVGETLGAQEVLKGLVLQSSRLMLFPTLDAR